VVESPAKAKTINKYLGNDYKVLASMGHIRQLPHKNGSVDPNNDFAIKYESIPKSAGAVKALSDVAKVSERILLAPDPDREGEAIAWHVLEVLKQKKALKPSVSVQRVVFNAITKQSIDEAIKNPRQIDMDLVNAQQARVALDYLVGFTLSPVLWRKLPGSRSAGRVQSATLRLVCEREEEIERFKTQEYWTIDAVLLVGKKAEMIASLTHVDGKKLDKFDIPNEKYAHELQSALEKQEYKVLSIERKQTKKNPYPPFTTSTLQQDASRRLGFSAKKTMMIAQKLYEAGHITYMRTDGVYTAPEAIGAARDVIKSKYGAKYLPTKPIMYQNKVKNAQEAHEAIRPTHLEVFKAGSNDDETRLYELIWKRLIASQMQSVVFDSVSIVIEAGDYLLKSTGSVVKFDGFYVLYGEHKDDNESHDAEGKILPDVKEGEKLDCKKVESLQHFTEPPPRYSEASLVKKMEELGIGRPSTYASILSVIQDREYVKLEKKRFIPEERGRIVVAFLKKFFEKYVQYDYTAKLEDDLDVISNGKADWKKFLREFWEPFNAQVGSTMTIHPIDVVNTIMQDLREHIFGFDKNGNLQDTCPECKTGKLTLRLGKFGAFISCSNYPDCKYIKNIQSLSVASGESDSGDNGSQNTFETKLLGEDIYLKKGPYGFYVQKGADSKDKGHKPKKVGIPKTNKEPQNTTLEQAKSLLSLPRVVGSHPDDNEEIKANIGPFGPYLLYNKKFYSIKKDYDIMTIDLSTSLAIIKEKSDSKGKTKRKNV